MFILSLLLIIIMLQSLKAFNAEELHILKSHFGVNSSLASCSSFMRLVFHNLNMTFNSVAKHYFVVLNVKLQVKRDSESLIDF